MRVYAVYQSMADGERESSAAVLSYATGDVALIFHALLSAEKNSTPRFSFLPFLIKMLFKNS